MTSDPVIIEDNAEYTVTRYEVSDRPGTYSYETVFKPGSAGANEQSTVTEILADVARLEDVRTSSDLVRDAAIALRDGTDFTAMTNNQRDRAFDDIANGLRILASNQRTLARALLHIIRAQRRDYTAAPE